MWKKARALIQKPTFVEKLIAFIASSPLLIFLLLSLLRKNVQTPMQFSRLSRHRAFLRQVNRAKIRQRGAPPPPVSRGKILSNRENSVRTARERNKNIPFFFFFFSFARATFSPRVYYDAKESLHASCASIYIEPSLSLLFSVAALNRRLTFAILNAG